VTQPEPFGATEPEDTASSPEGRRRGRRIAHAIVWPVLALLVIGAGVAAWLLFNDAMSVRSDLEDARATVSTLQGAVNERDLAALPALASELSESASSAVAPTEGPLWRAGELVPGLGENLRGVRTIAESIDRISEDVVGPGAELAGSFGLARDPATGGFDVSSISTARDVVEAAATEVDETSAALAGLDTGAMIPQVADAVTQYEEVLEQVDEQLPAFEGGIQAVSTLLGMDGPKNVVLAFLNNAEAAALGGGPAAQTLLRVDNGTITVAQQVSSVDFADRTALPVTVDDSAMQLYNDIFLTEPNGSTSRPDFPTASMLISAAWQRSFGITPDVVVSIDPLALGRLLEVTGPVALPDGEQLTNANVVSKLLNEAYFRFPQGGAESDAYFAGAASAVFDRVLSADYDVWEMSRAVVDAANRGSLMMWSADPETQAMFDGTRLQGTLPQGNDGATVVGVYFRDRSVSKIDYYLHTEAVVTTNACTPDAPTYTIEVRLRFDIPADLELPQYVDSTFYDFYRTEVFLYGPIGAATTAVEVPEAGLATTTGPSVVDLGRPAEKFTVDLENGQSAVVRATFTGAPGEYGPTEVRTTPMINATAVTLADTPC
jgi:Protein of unknown function (DUF4012)